VYNINSDLAPKICLLLHIMSNNDRLNIYLEIHLALG